MGYTTEFYGSIAIDPPCNEAEIAYINLFQRTRRMDRAQGPYYAFDDGNFGQSCADGVRDYNKPPAGQPGLWCGWCISADGTAIEWDGGEKFYDSAEWMAYLINHFLKPGGLAGQKEPGRFSDFQFNHTCNGEIEAQGEDHDDSWFLIVENNKVSTQAARVVRARGTKRRVG